MMYSDLPSALGAINDLGNYDFDTLVSCYDIDVQYTYSLSENINGYTLPLTRTLFINVFSESQEFTKYHELVHCLVDDTAEPLIETCFVSNSRIEHRANLGALYLMIQNYILQNDVYPESFSVTDFLQQYDLTKKYFDTAMEVAREIFTAKLPVDPIA